MSDQLSKSGDVNALQNELLGPSYDYGAQIYTPDQLGMSDRGTLDALAKDLGGLIGYTQLLVEGGGKASKVNGPLGNKFFMETASKCTDVATDESVTRSIYVNNVPDGSVPFLSSGSGGVRFNSFKGLIPGIVSNIAQINPFQIVQSFMTGSSPECQLVEMETIDVNNIKSRKKGYISNTDLEVMNPCWFPNKRNPLTGGRCSEGFRPLLSPAPVAYDKMPDDTLIKIYYSSLGILGLYILFRLLYKSPSSQSQ